MIIAALDIGGTAIKAGLLNNDGEIIVRKEYVTQAHGGASSFMDQMCEIVRELGNADRVGISISGQVDPKTGGMRFATDTFPNFTGTPLRKILKERLGVPVAVDNDVNCAAIGEAHYGSGKGYSDFLCVTYGTGIGGAIVLDNKIFYGTEGSAGEVGHILTHADGLPCVCGSKGCYEMYGSAKALSVRVHKLTGECLNGKEIFSRFHETPIRREIDCWIDEIVYGLCSLAHIFNPSCFVLGGGILNEHYILEQIRDRLEQRLIPSFRNVAVKRTAMGNLSGMMGAYYNAVHNAV